MMKGRITEGHKMWLSVMAIFLVYAITFILFEDYDRRHMQPFDEPSDWHLLLFSVVVMAGLAWLLHRYARHMDERIDREQAERQNAMRRELTQNIAHELKTPVASIQGYLETLIDNTSVNEETRRLFLRRSYHQARRLTALLQDISTLNRMDFAPAQHEFAKVDVAAIIGQTVEDTAQAVGRQQMTFCMDVPAHICVRGNFSLLYSIFRNLTDNATAYAGTGTTITLTATEHADHWHFTFADNGTGVATEHLPRLFERFYRIDKGRSRSLGGTGLGLAIVKNAVLLHGGSIEARHNDGGGLCFEFTIRKESRTR